ATFSDRDNQAMSDEIMDQPAQKKKGKGALVKGVVALALVGAGGGAAFGLQSAGVFSTEGGQKVKEDTKPKLILKGEEDPYAPAAAEGEAEGALDVPGDGGNKYRTAYFTFTEDF